MRSVLKVLLLLALLPLAILLAVMCGMLGERRRCRKVLRGMR